MACLKIVCHKNNSDKFIENMIYLENPYNSYEYNRYKMDDLDSLLQNSNMVFLAFKNLGSLVVLTLYDACRLRYVSRIINLLIHKEHAMTTNGYQYNKKGAWIIPIDFIPTLFSVKFFKPFAKFIINPPLPPTKIKDEIEKHLYIQKQAKNKIIRTDEYTQEKIKITSDNIWTIILELLNILGFTSVSEIPDF